MVTCIVQQFTDKSNTCSRSAVQVWVPSHSLALSFELLCFYTMCIKNYSLALGYYILVDIFLKY